MISRKQQNQFFLLIFFINLVLGCSESLTRKISKAESLQSNTEELSRLARENNEEIRKLVALNPKTSVMTLEVLANDESDIVRESVARNPNTSLQILTSALSSYNCRV